MESVFVGPFTLEAAQRVASEGPAAGVEHLLSRCLLTRASDVGGQARYRMLQVIRQYAREQADPERWSSARARHLAYYAELARWLEAGLRTQMAPECASLARGCAQDLRAAVRFALEVRSPVVGSLVADLYWPWFLDGRLVELRSWAEAARLLTPDLRTQARLDRVLASTSIALGDTAGAEHAVSRQLEAGRALRDDQLIAMAQNLLGMVAWARGDATAFNHHIDALHHAQEAGEPWLLALITALAGRAAHAAGFHNRGDDLLAEAFALADELGEPMVLGSALDYQAHAAFEADSHHQAGNLTGRALAAYQSIGYQEGLASALTLAACVAVFTGQHEVACKLLTEAYEACQRMGHSGGIATVLEAAAILNHDQRDYQAAIRALAAASAQRSRGGTAVPPELAERVRRVESQLQSAVEPEMYALHWQAGLREPATLPCP